MQKSSERVEKAIRIATRIHKNQVDKAGRPYIDHCLRVMDTVHNEEDKIVAVLHDALEDGGGMAREIILKTFGLLVLGRVFALTRQKDETYSGYIRWVKSCGYSIKAIKISDLKDNLHPDRRDAIPTSLIKRYEKALKELEGAE